MIVGVYFCIWDVKGTSSVERLIVLLRLFDSAVIQGMQGDRQVFKLDE